MFYTPKPVNEPIPQPMGLEDQSMQPGLPPSPNFPTELSEAEMLA